MRLMVLGHGPLPWVLRVRWVAVLVWRVLVVLAVGWRLMLVVVRTLRGRHVCVEALRRLGPHGMRLLLQVRVRGAVLVRVRAVWPLAWCRAVWLAHTTAADASNA